jgi:hypothetical protein
VDVFFEIPTFCTKGFYNQPEVAPIIRFCFVHFIKEGLPSILSIYIKTKNTLQQANP